MSSESSIEWHDDFLGVAYRYYDLRMNIAPLFSDRKEAANLWNDVIHWWLDPTIKVRFVETGDEYWLVMISESKKPETNLGFFKILPKSANYERFKKGHGGEAYLRFGMYAKKYYDDVKDDAICDCGHEKFDHDEEKNNSECLFEDCECKKFESFQVTLLKKKKTITDIKFLNEDDVKNDAIAWNCLYVNKYKDSEK